MANGLFDVTTVDCMDGNLLFLRFEDGASGFFDMTPWLTRKPYDILRNEALFKRAKVECGTVVWPGEIDIDPETLRGGMNSAPAPLSVAEPSASYDA